MTEVQEDYLENDSPILGQNYVCLSFVSPDKLMKQKEMYCFHRYMVNKFKEYGETIDRLLDKENEEAPNFKKLEKELKDRARLEFKYDYKQFNDNYQDFLYKNGDELNGLFDKENDFKTSIRGLKVRGVYETYKEAEIRAKALQRRDRSFHVFVGTVGAWLPWDPEPDKVQNEEYLEDELNTLIQEYKKNQVHKDMLYEQEKQDRKTDTLKKKIAEEELEKQAEDNQRNMATIEEKLDMEDPWMQRQNQVTAEPTAEPTTESTAEPTTESTAEPTTESTAEPTTESTAEHKQ